MPTNNLETPHQQSSLNHLQANLKPTENIETDVKFVPPLHQNVGLVPPKTNVMMSAHCVNVTCSSLRMPYKINCQFTPNAYAAHTKAIGRSWRHTITMCHIWVTSSTNFFLQYTMYTVKIFYILPVHMSYCRHAWLMVIGLFCFLWQETPSCSFFVTLVNWQGTLLFTSFCDARLFRLENHWCIS